MTIARTLEDACTALAEHPDSLLLAGGTDLTRRKLIVPWVRAVLAAVLLTPGLVTAQSATVRQ